MSKIVDDVILGCEGLGADALKVVRDVLCEVLDDYDVTPKVKALTIYKGYLPDCYEKYFGVKLISGLSKGTLSLYRFYLDHFFRYVNRPLEEIDSDTIHMFLYYYQKERGIDDRTKDTMRTCISAFFSWANAAGYVSKNPCLLVEPIKFQRKERYPLSDMELEMLRQACSTPRDVFIVEFLYSTGCRVSEFTNVKISDLDMRRKECEVLGKGRKRRIVYFNARCELAIKNYLEATGRTLRDSGYLLLREREGIKKKDIPMDPGGVQLVCRALGEKAGIDRRVHPHLLRHTFATNGINRGASVEQIQRMLGHSSISTTMIYAHVDTSQLRAEHMRCIV